MTLPHEAVEEVVGRVEARATSKEHSAELMNAEASEISGGAANIKYHPEARAYDEKTRALIAEATDLRAIVHALREAEARATVLAGEVEGLRGACQPIAAVVANEVYAQDWDSSKIAVRVGDLRALAAALAALPLPGGSGDIVVASREDARPQPEAGVGVKPLSEAQYAALGRACEGHGLGWYIDDGTMRFQPPADVIEEQARGPLLQALSKVDHWLLTVPEPGTEGATWLLGVVRNAINCHRIGSHD